MATVAPTMRFERIRCLGEGGAGVVYEALDRELGAHVALKTLRNVTAESLGRLKREFRAMQDVHHPNLVSLGELVSENGECFFTMELIEGVDWLDFVRPSRSLIEEVPLRGSDRPSALMRAALVATQPSGARYDEPRLRDGLRQLAEALSALHRAGLVHRDVKPSNVRVTPEGRVVLLDFGLVVATSGSNPWTQEAAGTPAYMAPEQVASSRVGPEADWYAVGVLLFEALTGTFPFVGAALQVMMRKQREEPPAPSTLASDVPPDLDALSVGLLRPDPAARPTGSQVLLALGGIPSSHALPTAGSQTNTAPFVGRVADMDALLSAFHDSRRRPVTVVVEGESGVGKSTLVRQFLQRLARQVADVVVLAGRCYERESVPYKAFDGVVDALARVLSRLPKAEASELVPTKPAPLVKVFPVLRRVAPIAERVRGELLVLDPHELRARAFSALRELFTRLADRRPLVLVIDDAQWADADSLALLAELMRPPEAPPLLLVMTARTGASVPILAEPATTAEPRRPTLASTLSWEVRRIALGALPPDDASALAIALLERAGVTDPEIAEWSARQAGGHPLFIDMMTRRAGRLTGEANANLQLGDVLWGIIGQLEDTPRKILETVSVADAPMAQEAVARAAGVEAGVFAKAVSRLRVSHMVQTRGARGADRIEPYHDRVRVAVLAHLDAARRTEVHRRIALALEASDPIDPDALVVHWRGAGDLEQTARFAGLAGDRAAEALAFDRAASFYELALTHDAPLDDPRRALLVKLGDARANAGRGESAAKAFREAAEGATAGDALELRRREAEELLMAGEIDAGGAALHRVLAAADMRAPRSPLAALFWLVVYRLWAVVLGLRFKERGRDEVPRDVRARIDALFAAARGFAVVDPGLCWSMGTRNLLIALRKGDTFQVLCAAALEMATFASRGGRVSKREQSLTALAQRLANTEENSKGKGFFQSCLGVSFYLRGDFRKAHELLELACSGTRTLGAGWQSNANVFGAWTLMFLGQFRELGARHAHLLADAEARGDLYTSVQLRDGYVAVLWLAADDPGTARRHIREAMAQWSRTRFLLQHWHAMCGEAEIELYLGDGARAHERCARDLSALEKSLLLSCQHVRIVTAFTLARCAIASIEAAPDLAHRRLAEARRLARRLARERMPNASAYAAILAAVAANATGDRPAAVASLRTAIELAEASGMAMHAAAARYQLGSLLGDDDGRTLVRQAEEAMAAQDVRAPARLAGMWLPGHWATE